MDGRQAADGRGRRQTTDATPVETLSAQRRCPVLEPVAGAAGHEDGDGRTEDGTGASTVGTARWLLAVSGLAGPLRPSSALLGRSLVHWALAPATVQSAEFPPSAPWTLWATPGTTLAQPADPACAVCRHASPPTSLPARYQVHYRHPCAPLSIPVAAGLQSALTAYSHPLHPPRSTYTRITHCTCIAPHQAR